MWNVPPNAVLDKVPRLYETEHVPLNEKVVHAHFFLGGCDWYVAEFDGEDLFWGYAILNNDIEMGEWGYISFEELKSVRVGFLEVDFDLHWQPKRASEIQNITNL